MLLLKFAYHCSPPTALNPEETDFDYTDDYLQGPSPALLGVGLTIRAAIELFRSMLIA
jgi:hypothetical protein